MARLARVAVAEVAYHVTPRVARGLGSAAGQPAYRDEGNMRLPGQTALGLPVFIHDEMASALVTLTATLWYAPPGLGSRHQLQTAVGFRQFEFSGVVAAVTRIGFLRLFVEVLCPAKSQFLLEDLDGTDQIITVCRGGGSGLIRSGCACNESGENGGEQKRHLRKFSRQAGALTCGVGLGAFPTPERLHALINRAINSTEQIFFSTPGSAPRGDCGRDLARCHLTPWAAWLRIPWDRGVPLQYDIA